MIWHERCIFKPSVPVAAADAAGTALGAEESVYR
jgi:hypothetical protein